LTLGPEGNTTGMVAGGGVVAGAVDVVVVGGVPELVGVVGTVGVADVADVADVVGAAEVPAVVDVLVGGDMEVDAVVSAPGPPPQLQSDAKIIFAKNSCAVRFRCSIKTSKLH
jgi:hypothetical protein